MAGDTSFFAFSDATHTDGPIADYLADLLARIRPIRDGAVATYIPELAKANPNHCGIAIATLDGIVYAAGDCDQPFTIQSVSKPFLFGLALQELGREAVLKHVGVEPTGEAFNSTVLDKANNRPFNPMVNAGAIAVSSLVPGATYEARRESMRGLFTRLAGREARIDETVFRSEQRTGNRNRAIAKLMRKTKMIGANVGEILDLYFSQCSVLATTRDLALMAAALANDGINPLTGETALARESVPDALTVMNTCGMYNYAGQWSYEIGMPAKSGVSGAIIAVIPGQAGIAIYSPPLDSFGNSVRAVAACKLIAADFGLHTFRTNPNSGVGIRRDVAGDVVRSKRTRTPQERAILTERGAAIRVIEAQGALFFGSVERLARRAGGHAASADYVILDLRRVFSIDAAGLALLVRLNAAVKAGGKRLIFAHLDSEGPLASLFAALKAQGGDGDRIVFADRDRALEFCENRVIAAASPGPVQSKFALADLPLFQGLSGADLKTLETVARPFVYEPGAAILKEGDAARLFFVIVQGVASVRLNLPDERGVRAVRIASVGPGGALGDMALLDGGPRSADAFADERVVCYGFSVEEIRELDPKILLVILTNLARDLAERLRGANSEIRALEQ